MLAVLTDALAIGRAAMALERTLRAGCQKRRCSLGYQGGGGEYDVFWSTAHHFWSVLDRAHNRHWFCFGDHPSPHGPVDGEGLGIVCEINPPLEGINRRCAGAFACNEGGRVVLTHNGRVGGGRPGIGKTAFLDSLKRPVIDSARWPDGVAVDVLVMGPVDGAELPARIGEFVRAVRSFKDQAARGR